MPTSRKKPARYERNYEEQLLLHKEERSLVDLYVEGRTDRCIFEYVLSGHAHETRVNIYEAEHVDVPGANGYGGNKARLLTLAGALRKDRADFGRLMVVVDRDFDYLLGLAVDDPPVKYTDYSGIELYYFNESALNKLLLLGELSSPAPIRQLFESKIKILVEVFLLFAANESLRWNLPAVDFTAALTITDHIAVLDESRLVDLYLNKDPQRIPQKAAFKAQIASLRRSLHADHRMNIKSHHIGALLAWYIKKLRRDNRKLADAEAVEASLRMQIEPSHFRGQPLFQHLENLLNTTS